MKIGIHVDLSTRQSDTLGLSVCNQALLIAQPRRRITRQTKQSQFVSRGLFTDLKILAQIALELLLC